MKKLYTLGTSNRTIEEFLEILDFYQIKTVVDVRHWPTSRFFPHFKRENLEKILREQKRKYYHLENVGGYRKGGYEKYTKTKDFKEGIENLIQLINKKTSGYYLRRKTSLEMPSGYYCPAIRKKENKNHSHH